MVIKRHLQEKLGHFKDKLLFVSGPRQTGKTFLVENVLQPTWSLNMDVASERLVFKKFPQTALDWYATHHAIKTNRRSGLPAHTNWVFIGIIISVKWIL
ncbi:MAG: hypothetical protein ACD_62C00424G0002 [uncultured bacterium]|nr:MAG: hypothetical protein ACD_62C00424G0002 [uncultured bacterium]